MLRHSSVQERLAVLLILLQAATLAWFSETVAFPLTVSLAAFALWSGHLRVPIPPQRRILAVFALLVGFVVKWRVAPPYEPQQLTPFLLFPLALAVAQFFITLQVGQLVTRSHGDPPPPSLPLFSVFALICAADVHATHRERFVFHLALLAYAVLTPLYFSAGRIWLKPFRWRENVGRSVISSLVLFLVLGVSWIGSDQLLKHWDDLERLMDYLVSREQRSSALGFDRESQLGSMKVSKMSDPMQSALRIVTDVPPGYLRGTAYDRLIGSRWHAPPPRIELYPAALQPPQAPSSIAGKFVFPLKRIAAKRWQPFEIWPDAALNDTIFMPLNTAIVDVPVNSITMDDHQTVVAENMQPAYGYTVYAPFGFEMEPLPADLRQRLLEVPPKIADSAESLAKRLFADLKTEREKLVAVEQYFRHEYEYSLDVRIPADQNPLTYFLTKRPAAHCEYFASGATMVLRMAGIPTRYVTGFVASETNPVGDYWIVRNRDAHAWCEAYVTGEGWKIVDATPTVGIPLHPEMHYAHGLWDDFKLRIQTIRGALARGGIRDLGEAILLLFSALTTTTPGLVITGALLAWLMIVGFRTWVPRFKRHVDPVRAPFQRLLSRMDRELRSWQLARGPDETLHQFSLRIRSTESAIDLTPAADWYLQYASLRYQSLDNPDLVRMALQQLRETLPDLRS